MNGDVFDIKRFAIHDGPGIRTTVFMRGCPLDCWWCHNPEASLKEADPGSSGGWRYGSWMEPGKRPVGLKVDARSVMAEVSADKVFYEVSGGGVTFSGGEPLAQPGFLIKLLEMCRKEGISAAVDTSGCVEWKVIEDVYAMVDLFLYDLKLVEEKRHIEYTGMSNSLIIENFERLAGMGEKVLPRVPLIPGITDTADNVEKLADLLAGYQSVKSISLLPYNMMARDKSRRLGREYRPGKLKTQSPARLSEIAEVFAGRGLEVTIGG